MKNKTLLAIRTILVIFCSVIAFSGFTPDRNTTQYISDAPLLSIYVYVSQQPDICGVESPCSAYVRIRNGSTDIATPQLYTGQGLYTFSTGDYHEINAIVTNNYPSGGCDCVVYSTNPSQNGPPYFTFSVSIW